MTRRVSVACVVAFIGAASPGLARAETVTATFTFQTNLMNTRGFSPLPVVGVPVEVTRLTFGGPGGVQSAVVARGATDGRGAFSRDFSFKAPGSIYSVRLIPGDARAVIVGPGAKEFTSTVWMTVSKLPQTFA